MDGKEKVKNGTGFSTAPAIAVSGLVKHPLLWIIVHGILSLPHVNHHVLMG